MYASWRIVRYYEVKTHKYTYKAFSNSHYSGCVGNFKFHQRIIALWLVLHILLRQRGMFADLGLHCRQHSPILNKHLKPYKKGFVMMVLPKLWQGCLFQFLNGIPDFFFLAKKITFDNSWHLMKKIEVISCDKGSLAPPFPRLPIPLPTMLLTS